MSNNLSNSKNHVILIGVESAANLGVLFDYLRGFGFDVLVVDNGEIALKIAQEHRPDIILLDIILLGINGFETCRRLKSNEITHDIPVIFITSLTNTVDKIRGFSVGAVDFITKPIQSEEVVARLKTHLTIQDLQDTLQEKNTRLKEEIVQREKLIAELDSFAHTVAHDLKNPLGATINYAQFITKYMDDISADELQEYAETIVRNGYKMASIIDELLLLASVRTEKIEMEPLDMAKIVAETQSRLAYMIEESKAKIIIPDDWPIGWGYGPWVEEVWANYLSNAIKYGGQPPHIELGFTIGNNGLIKFWVQDNGAGLSPEAQALLFVPFTRLNQAQTQGHGLGLSIVQRIVKKLGGKVGVESEGMPGKGSTFSFYLQIRIN